MKTQTTKFNRIMTEHNAGRLTQVAALDALESLGIRGAFRPSRPSFYRGYDWTAQANRVWPESAA
jgi:hypothetical protein